MRPYTCRLIGLGRTTMACRQCILRFFRSAAETTRCSATSLSTPTSRSRTLTSASAECAWALWSWGATTNGAVLSFVSRAVCDVAETEWKKGARDSGRQILAGNTVRGAHAQRVHQGHRSSGRDGHLAWCSERRMLPVSSSGGRISADGRGAGRAPDRGQPALAAGPPGRRCAEGQHRVQPAAPSP
jgi:hypothetical protein